MNIEILQGDVLTVLRTLPSESVHCCINSPPYWGLRDYGVAGQGGLEPTLGEHLEWIVTVFREVRRVLRHDGTLWLNYGDAYASQPNGRSAADTKAIGNDDRTFRDKPISTIGAIQARSNGGEGQHFDRRGGIMKPKDRMLLPARVAIALHEDGWWIRDEIVWHKPNPMPSSVKDRTTPAHEMIYMLAKNPTYYYDFEAVKEEATVLSKVHHPNGWARGKGSHGTIHPDGRTDTHYAEIEATGKRNKRSVWTVPPKGFKEAHFATFPPALIEPCILAGCPWGGTVLDPFGGAGTTGLVARANGRNSILIELNPEYVGIARRRLFPQSFPWSAP